MERSRSGHLPGGKIASFGQYTFLRTFAFIKEAQGFETELGHIVERGFAIIQSCLNNKS